MMATARAPLPRYRGRIDRIEPDSMNGWAYIEDGSQERAELEILLDGELLAVVVADNNRPDLQEAGIGDGRHGFRFTAPPGKSLDPMRLRVLFRGTGVPLRPPTGPAGEHDPLTGQLSELTKAVATLHHITRQQLHDSDALHKGVAEHVVAKVDNAVGVVERVERFIAIGFAKSLSDGLTIDLGNNTEARLVPRLRRLEWMQGLIFVLLAAIVVLLLVR